MSPSTKDLKPSVPEPDEVAPATSAGRGPAASIVRVIAAILMIALAVGFFFVHHSRNEAEAPLIDETNKETQMPAVNVVTIAASSGSQSLRSPGETAAWNETVIYARCTAEAINPASRTIRIEIDVPNTDKISKQERID